MQSTLDIGSGCFLLSPAVISAYNIHLVNDFEKSGFQEDIAKAENPSELLHSAISFARIMPETGI